MTAVIVEIRLLARLLRIPLLRVEGVVVIRDEPQDGSAVERRTVVLAAADPDTRGDRPSGTGAGALQSTELPRVAGARTRSGTGGSSAGRATSGAGDETRLGADLALAEAIVARLAERP